MIFTLFYISSAIESFLLGAYLAFVGSNPQESLILNLSPSRLAAVLVFILIGLGFIYLASRSLNSKSKQFAIQEKYLDNERSQWTVFILSVAALGLALFLLTRQLNSFGEFKQIYERFEPALVWLFALGVQAAFLTAVWYFAYFITGDGEGNKKATEKELLPLFGLYLAFVLFKLVFITRSSYGPVARGDEMTYYDMADSLYRGFFSIAQTSHYPPLYPLSLVPAMVFKIWTFEGIKLLNVIYSSSILFPVYFISRRFLNPRYSLAAAFLSCLIPFHLVFPRRIVSENLYLPLFLWALAINLTIPRSRTYRIHWDILTGLMISLLYLTRYITLAAIPFFLLGWWIKPFEGETSLFKPGWKKVIRFSLLICVMLAGFSPWLISGLRENVQLKLILGFGIYSRTNPASLTLRRLLVWAVLYACYFILVAAPVLHLLIVSFFQVDYKRWRESLGLWIFQVLLIMGGFYIAVTNHSWRAWYNAVIPHAIMGRYLILFSVVYFVIALATASRFRKSTFRSKWQFIIFAQAIPFILVIFSYLAIIKATIFPTDGELLKSLGSVDASYIEKLGVYFFVLLFLIYGVTNWLMWKGSIKPALSALTAGLVLYYIIGIPAYYQDVMQYQTYPWLASQIAQLSPQPDLKTGDYEQITVFLPKERTDKNPAEIYNGLRVRGINKTIIEINTQQAVNAMTTNQGFIIQRLDGAQPQQGLRVYRFNDQDYQIIPVQKP